MQNNRFLSIEAKMIFYPFNAIAMPAYKGVWKKVYGKHSTSVYFEALISLLL